MAREESVDPIANHVSFLVWAYDNKVTIHRACTVCQALKQSPKFYIHYLIGSMK